MDYSYNIELLKLSNFTLPVEFQIELKEFTQFKRTLKTDKYINLTDWETIIRNIHDLTLTLEKYPSDIENHSGHFTTDDECLSIEWQFKKKNECCINFKKLKMVDCHEKMLHVRIRRSSSIIHDQKPLTPDLIDVPNENEYDPLTSHVISRDKRYKAGGGKNNEQKINVEYSPKPLKNEDDDMKVNKKSLNYTPTKISKSQPTELSKTIFGFVTDDEESEKDILKSEGSWKNKRKLPTTSTTESTSSTVTSKQSLKKKLKTNDNNQPTIDSYVNKKSCLETPNRRKKKQILSAAEVMTEQNLEKINNFIKNAKNQEEQKKRRLRDLESLEMLDCHSLTLETLKKYVNEFTPKIRQFFEKQPSSNEMKGKYNPVLMTTSNIFTERQLSYVMKQVEMSRLPEDRGTNEDILSNIVLPEFIIYVFGKSHNLNESEVMSRLRDQDEKRSILNMDLTQIF